MDKFFVFLKRIIFCIYLFIFVAIKEVVYILLYVDNGKIGIFNLERVLKNLNVNLIEEDFNEVFKSCDMSGEYFFGLRFF